MMTRRGAIFGGAAAASVGATAYGLWPTLGTYTDQMAHLRRPLPADPAMEDLVRYATLAPNGHNTQPWKFRLTGAGVSVSPDFSRRTEVVDPDDHHLFISLGCAAETFKIAAEAHGHASATSVKEGSGLEINIDLVRAAAKPSPLYDAIPFRQTTRSEFDGQTVSSSDLAHLQAAAAEDGVTVLLLTDKQQREDILDFVVQGNSAQMTDAAFVAELRQWIRFSPKQALVTGDGLFGACSGNPITPSWMGGALFKMVFKEEAENDKYRAHIRSSAGVAVFVGDKADPAHWIKVGRSFQRFALQATALGIRTAHINQPIEVPEVRGEFASWLGMAGARPDLVIRFGHGAALPMSARRLVPDVLIA